MSEKVCQPAKYGEKIQLGGLDIPATEHLGVPLHKSTMDTASDSHHEECGVKITDSTNWQ